MLLHIRAHRPLWLLVLSLHLILPGLVGVAEAHAESDDPYSHIEALSFDCGAQGHPAQCALCQFLRTPATEPCAGFELPAADAPPADAPRQTAHLVEASSEYSALPRAPPALS